jgi:hypothetical protein
MKRTVVFLAAAALSACANQSNPAPAPAVARPHHVQQMAEPTVRLQSPVKVRWEEKVRTATSAEVVAHVERLNAVPVPLRMRVEVPAGVAVKQGRASVALPLNTEALTVSETYLFTFDATPTEDVLLRVDGDGEGMGFHFKVPYRFGRSEPEGSRPAATGPEFRKGEKSFGGTIPLK